MRIHTKGLFNPKLANSFDPTLKAILKKEYSLITYDKEDLKKIIVDPNFLTFRKSDGNRSTIYIFRNKKPVLYINIRIFMFIVIDWFKTPDIFDTNTVKNVNENFGYLNYTNLFLNIIQRHLLMETKYHLDSYKWPYDLNLTFPTKIRSDKNTSKDFKLLFYLIKIFRRYYVQKHLSFDKLDDPQVKDEDEPKINNWKTLRLHLGNLIDFHKKELLNFKGKYSLTDIKWLAINYLRQQGLISRWERPEILVSKELKKKLCKISNPVVLEKGNIAKQNRYFYNDKHLKGILNYYQNVFSTLNQQTGDVNENKYFL